MLDQRGQLLRAAVGFAGCPMLSYDRVLWALRTWLPYEPGPTRRWLNVEQPARLGPVTGEKSDENREE